MDEVLFVLELKASFLLVTTLEDEGFMMVSQHGWVFIYRKGVTQDIARVIGVRQG